MTEAGGNMATSVGQIGLDLVVNKNQFESQMKGNLGIAKKAGAALGSSFWSKAADKLWKTVHGAWF